MSAEELDDEDRAGLEYWKNEHARMVQLAEGGFARRQAEIDLLTAENKRLREALAFFPAGMNWAIRKANAIADGIDAKGLSDSELILGSIMRGDASAGEIAPILGPRKLKPTSVRMIFQALIDLDVDGSPNDPVSVSELLEKRNQLAAVGGLSYLGSITRDTPREDVYAAFKAVGRLLRSEG